MGAAGQATGLDLVSEARRQWEERWGPGPALPMAAVTSIMRVQQLLMAELNALLKPLDLTFPRYEALMLLSFTRTGALPLGKIGERLQVSPASVTNAVDRLESSGFVAREPHPTDGRATLAGITDAGRAVVERATTALTRARFGAHGLDDAAARQLFDLLVTFRGQAGDFPA